METPAVQERCYVTPFTIIPGYKEHQQAISNLTNASWAAVYSALWNGVVFSSEEEAKGKLAIRMLLLEAANLPDGYVELIERILLSRRYLHTDLEPLRQNPEQWFNVRNKKGYCRSAYWYGELQVTRKSKPLHGLGLKAFADAVLEMTEAPNSKNYHYWRQYFMERHQQALLNLFLTVVAYTGKCCK